MKAITIFFVFALLFVSACTTASESYMFFDNRNNIEYKVTTKLYKNGIEIKINDIRTVFAKFSAGQEEIRATGNYLGHTVELFADFDGDRGMGFCCWVASVYIDGESAVSLKEVK